MYGLISFVINKLDDNNHLRSLTVYLHYWLIQITSKCIYYDMPLEYVIQTSSLTLRFILFVRIQRQEGKRENKGQRDTFQTCTEKKKTEKEIRTILMDN